MPSVGMRRTTRVFGARVLRSGRRLFTVQEEVKHMRRAPLAVADAEEGWIELLDRGGGGGDDVGDVEFKENGWHNSSVEINQTNDVMDIDNGEIQLEKTKEEGSVGHEGLVKENKRWGMVYTRKRKRTISFDSGLKCTSSEKTGSDKKYGKKFIRKQARRKINSKDSPSPIAEELPSIVTSDRDQTLSESLAAVKAKSGRKKARVLVSKPAGQNPPRRNGGGAGPGTIQKRRSSLRSRKRRNPSSFGLRKSSGTRVSDLLSKQDGVPFFPIKSNPEISRSIQRLNVKELKSTLAELTQDIDSASCKASILMIQQDRCYREVGAVVTMETSAPQQWFLVVKKDGIERFRVEAQHVMRPCFCNRITRAIIWAGGDDSWRLEFPSRQDWFVFKELYRKCFERSVPPPVVSIIPVPQVSEVSGYAEVGNSPFRLPDSYIRSRGDELARALEKSYPIYDMDSDDEEWLSDFNNECRGRNEPDSRVSEDSFEKTIVAFEPDNRVFEVTLEKSIDAPVPDYRVSEGTLEKTIDAFEPDSRVPDDTLEKTIDAFEPDNRLSEDTLEKTMDAFEPDNCVSEDTLQKTIDAFEPNNRVSEDTLQKTVDAFEPDNRVSLDTLEKTIDAFEPDNRVSEDTFEKIIDAFERGIYCSPDDYSDATSAVDRCLALASKEVLEAVYRYWMDKRKKKQSALIRVFQCYKPKRDDPLSFKAVLRKKRSFKRHGNQSGRGKQLTFLKAAQVEQEAHAAAMKVEEAEAAARAAEQAAVANRQRAQVLMEVADLATYKATMALQIAEARASVDVTDSTLQFFLHE